MNTMHAYPMNDLMEHETDGEDCVCGPAVRHIKHDDGTSGWIILHHSLDGRESNEPQ